MTDGPIPPAIPLENIREFLARTAPFSGLPPQLLDETAKRFRAAAVPRGTVLLERGVSTVDHLRLIYEGRVRLSLTADNGEVTLEDFRGPGEMVGHLAILRGSLSNLNVMAVEDTVALLLDREYFLDLLKSDLGFAHFFLKALSEGYVSKALDSLQHRRAAVGAEGTLYLFNAQVGDIIRRRPIAIPANESIRRAAQLMTERRVGCLLLTDQSEKIVGIVTDRDLRNKVVAEGLSGDGPVESIMATPIHTIPAHTVCFDALLEMMKLRVHHLVIERRGEVVGVISGHDLMVIQGSSPLYLVREIMEVRRVESLYDLSLKSPRVVRNLIAEGARASNVTRMITLINDYIRARLQTLVEQKIGAPPRPYTWLLMGSEGRREQTFRTDQDNGLIYQDPENPEEAGIANEYFALLAQEMVKGLVACGFPRCKGDVMASNPTWCQPYSVWQQYFTRWIQTPEPKDVLHATIFFDFRAGPGTEEVARELRTYLMTAVKGREVFFRLLAKDCLTTPPALSFFKQFTVEKSGPHKNRLDMKAKGLTPFVDFARLMALKHGVRETNTLERFQLLGEGGFISQEMRQATTQAVEFIMQLRLVHQMMMDEEGLEPDNNINPADLSEMERGTLKDALSVINDIKTYLKEAFQLASA